MASGSEKSFLSQDLQITGEIRSKGDIEVNGVIEGEISCRKLTIGEDAEFHGEAVADSIEVQGSLNGRIQAETVSLVNTAKVEGDILHRTLTIEPGAYIEGTARRLKNQAKPSEATEKPLSEQRSLGTADDGLLSFVGKARQA